jgi:hypothetical protein
MKLCSVVSLILLLATTAHADGIPRCWRADLPAEDIQDGLFRVHIATENREAREVALIMGTLGQSYAFQTGVAPSSDLQEIEIDMRGETKYWQASAAFPTLDAYKTAIVNSLAAVLKYDVLVECARVNHHGH